MKLKSVISISAIVIFVLFVFVGSLFVISNALKVQRINKQQSIVISDFSLVDQNGHVITKENLLGRYTVILFGFSRCTSVCPIQLGQLTEFLGSVTDVHPFDKLQVYFITLDPETDTQELLKDYSSAFHPKIQMLTGNRGVIDRLLKDFKVYVVPSEGSDINHSSILYFVGKDGKFLSSLDISNQDNFYRDIKRKMMA